MKIRPYSAWNLSQRRRNSTSDDDNQYYKRKEPGYAKGCCCSWYMLAAVLIGLLICAAGIIPAVTLLLTKPGQTTSSNGSTDHTSVGSNSTSTIGLSSTSSASTTVSSASSSTITSVLTSTTITLVTTSTTTISITTTITTTETTTTTTTITTTTTTTTTTAPYCLTRVTFDDIPGQLPTTGVVPNGYNNLNFTNFKYLNVSTMPTSGYQIGVSTMPFVAHNQGGLNITITSANGTRFSFDSVNVGSAWRDNLIWYIYGYRAGTTLVAANFLMDAMNWTTISCGACTNWDTIKMFALGGTPHTGLSQNGTEFYIDDLCISFGY